MMSFNCIPLPSNPMSLFLWLSNIPFLLLCFVSCLNSTLAWIQELR
jgi:hypothetical protein